MLPDFKGVKARIERDLCRWTMQQIPAGSPLLQKVPTFHQHEGKTVRIIREDGAEAPAGHYSVSSEIVQSRDDMKHSDLKSIREKLTNIAKQFGEAQTEQLLVAAGEAAEAVDNVVDAAGQLTSDKFLDVFRKVEMDFDSYTLQPKSGPFFAMHPQTAASVVTKLKEWERDPDFKAKCEKVIAVKREEWRDREANRRLVD